MGRDSIAQGEAGRAGGALGRVRVQPRKAHRAEIPNAQPARWTGIPPRWGSRYALETATQGSASLRPGLSNLAPFGSVHETSNTLGSACARTLSQNCAPLFKFQGAARDHLRF